MLLFGKYQIQCLTKGAAESFNALQFSWPQETVITHKCVGYRVMCGTEGEFSSHLFVTQQQTKHVDLFWFRIEPTPAAVAFLRGPVPLTTRKFLKGLKVTREIEKV